MKTRPHSLSGFSLVEVTLALGVVVFCLVAVFGLLAVGVSSTTSSIDQTAAGNVLTSIAADLESTPKAQTSPIFKITIPAALAATTLVTPAIYIGEDGQPTTTASSARYQLNVWTTGSTATQQETLVRLLISWPPQAPYTAAQGYVETVVALNRT